MGYYLRVNKKSYKFKAQMLLCPPLCLASFGTSQSVWGKASGRVGIPLTNPSLVI